MLKNNSLRVLSVLIAILMWAIVVSGQTETVSMTVPVKLMKAPSGYVAVSDTPNVSVIVKGPARIVSNLEYTSVVLNVDVSSIPVGNSQRRVLPNDFQSPVGVEVVEVTPQAINITVDQMASKQVKVIPTFIGDVAKGFKVESATTKPDSVIVEGAKTKLKKIDSISTAPINLSNVSANSTFSIGFKDEDGVKTVTPGQIEVSVTMRQVITKQTFKNVPVSCMGLKDGFKMKSEPKLSNVTVSGREDLVINFLDATMFLVNCAGITKAGAYAGAVAYDTTVTGVEVESISPQKINFEIVKK